MSVLEAAFGFILLSVVLLDAFEVIILPRRVSHPFRFARFFYRNTWRPWASAARWVRPDTRRETYLSFFGPLSLFLLLSVWSAGMIAGFAIVHWGLGSQFNVQASAITFGTCLYMSGTTFFTLGLGDVTPLTPVGRTLTVVEAGVGFGFLAAVISYLPVLYQAFSRREVSISLLDARAGSPPSAAELLRRHGQDLKELGQLLYEWEHWSAELLESHLSYPSLMYFRSQHTSQSWLAALTAVLDACALVIAGIDGGPTRQAQLTFAMARHAVVDLAQILSASPLALAPDRLPADGLLRLREMLAEAGVTLREETAVEQKLAELRRMYEPYVQALGDYLHMALPPWFPATAALDSWQTSAWGRITTKMAISARSGARRDEHF
jgi:hypothetical protein